MNKKLVTSLAASVMTITAASAAVADGGFSPYVGADAQIRHMAFKSGFGKNVAPDDYPQGNVYLGAHFCDWVGIEAGYESTIYKDRRATLFGNATVFGRPAGAVAGANSVFDTRVKIHGPHINLVGFLPISEAYCLQLFGSVGVAQLKIKIISDIPIADGITNPIFAADHREFSKRKIIPRATVGIQHMMTECLGLRASLGWENTSKFKNITPTVPSLLVAKVRDSYTAGLGIFFNF